MSQSKELTGFYKAMNEWLDKGTPDYKPFDISQGLCSNLDDYIMDITGLEYTEEFYLEISDQFRKAGLDKNYPFGGRELFEQELANHTMYENEARIKWIRDHANG